MQPTNQRLDDAISDLLQLDPQPRDDRDRLLGVVVNQTCQVIARRRRLKFLIPPMSAVAVSIATVLAALCISVDYPAMRQNAMVASAVVGDLERDSAIVGRITGMIGVEWTKTSQPPTFLSSLRTGQRFEFDSGMLELTYTHGARVILQGPVVYEVIENGGYLASGKLVAISHERVSASESASTHTDAASPGALPLCNVPPCRLMIRTPSALVADLGDACDVGVCIDADDSTRVEVHRGTAALCSTTETWEQCVEDAVPPPYRTLYGGDAVKAFIRNAPFGPVACCIAANPQPLMFDRDFQIRSSDADSVNNTARP